jgi:hypothetical protein
MANLLGGFGRKVLVSQTGTIAAVNSANFGVLEIGNFARLTGIVLVNSSNNNSSTIQFGWQAQSGTSLTTSRLAVTSGGLHFNVTNEANYVNLGITPVFSQTPYSIIVFGELAR